VGAHVGKTAELSAFIPVEIEGMVTELERSVREWLGDLFTE
tara:strand:- start:590 stop:712 length:123 start_codon:yes stop_codon:yes gene_type:complete